MPLNKKKPDQLFFYKNGFDIKWSMNVGMP